MREGVLVDMNELVPADEHSVAAAAELVLDGVNDIVQYVDDVFTPTQEYEELTMLRLAILQLARVSIITEAKQRNDIDMMELLLNAERITMEVMRSMRQEPATKA